MRRLIHVAFVSALITSADAHAMGYGLASFQNGRTALVAQGRIHRNEAARLLSFFASDRRRERPTDARDLLTGG
jgi:hypothetical protein